MTPGPLIDGCQESLHMLHAAIELESNIHREFIFQIFEAKS